jgi:hypothetical protein
MRWRANGDAAARKKTLAEMIGMILQRGLKEMRVHPSA